MLYRLGTWASSLIDALFLGLGDIKKCNMQVGFGYKVGRRGPECSLSNALNFSIPAETHKMSGIILPGVFLYDEFKIPDRRFPVVGRNQNVIDPRHYHISRTGIGLALNRFQ